MISENLIRGKKNQKQAVTEASSNSKGSSSKSSSGPKSPPPSPSSANSSPKVGTVSQEQLKDDPNSLIFMSSVIRTFSKRESIVCHTFFSSSYWLSDPFLPVTNLVPFSFLVVTTIVTCRGIPVILFDLPSIHRLMMIHQRVFHQWIYWSGTCQWSQHPKRHRQHHSLKPNIIIIIQRSSRLWRIAAMRITKNPTLKFWIRAQKLNWSVRLRSATFIPIMDTKIRTF